MKSKLITVCVVMSLMMVAPVGASEYQTALEKSADYLVSVQNTAGFWPSNPGGSWDVGAEEATGNAITSLLEAYSIVGKEAYKTAAVKAGDYLISVFIAGDGSFDVHQAEIIGGNAYMNHLSPFLTAWLMLYQETGEAKYRDAATSFGDYLLTDGARCIDAGDPLYGLFGYLIRPTGQPCFGTPASLYHGHYLNYGYEQIYGLALLAEITGNSAYLDAAKLGAGHELNYQKPDGSFPDEMGGTGTLGIPYASVKALAYLKLYERTSDTKYSDAVVEYIDWLLTQQDANGSFGNPDYVRSTTWAAKALLGAYKLTGNGDYLVPANKAVSWLLAPGHGYNSATGAVARYNQSANVYITYSQTPFTLTMNEAEAEIPTEVWVNASTGDDSNPGTEAEPFATIQRGIDAVAGSTVYVADGSYAADSITGKCAYITKDGVSLIGESATGTIIDGSIGGVGSSGSYWPRGIQVEANNVTIRNFTVKGFTGDTVNTGGYGVVFRDWTHDTPAEGYIFYSGCALENSIVQDCYSSVYALCFTHLTVSGCCVRDSLADGMFIARGSDYAAITNNIVTNSGNHGIWVGYCWLGLEPSDFANITSNTVDGAVEGGISFVGSNTATIAENTITRVAGAGPPDWDFWSVGALSLKDSPKNVEAYNNRIYGNTGLWNGVSGTGNGIGIDGTPSNINLHHNSIYGNTGYGCRNYSSVVVTAENNWWGAVGGPDATNNPHGDPSTGDGGGDAIGDYVDANPWLDADPTINILKLDVQGDPVYLQPGEFVVIDMDALNLAQHVFGCQAILNFSSTYFTATETGPGSPIVAPGGGIWDELIYSVWNTGGDLDVAVGVDLNSPVGTKADGTVAKFTLTVDPEAPDGVTTMVFRADGDDPCQTFFGDANGLAVYPGSKINSQDIVIDGTNPVVTVISPNGGENLKGNGSWTITWTATDPNIDSDSVKIEYYDGDSWELIAEAQDNDGSYNWSPVPSLNINNAKVRVAVWDLAGNEANDISDAVFIIDSTNPAVDDIKLVVEPGGVTDLTPSGTAVQGDYKVSAYVSDNDTGVDSGIDWTVLPTISVKDNAANELTHVGSVEADQANGRFTLIVKVASTTVNGSASISVSGVKDKSGNEAAVAGDTFNINKNQITGHVELEAFIGLSREVTFVATGITGKTWPPQTLTFSGGVAEFTLTDVPDGTTGLSAKTNWSLRRKLTGLSLDADGQLTGVNFTGSSSKLLGGDLNNSNTVNILDYSILKRYWYTTNPIADIDGSGEVTMSDYIKLKANFFKTGSPQ